MLRTPDLFAALNCTAGAAVGVVVVVVVVDVVVVFLVLRNHTCATQP